MLEIQVTELTKIYPGNVVALDKVDLHISSGMFGLLGPNGAGKTTLMRIMATLIRPSMGRVMIGGLDVSDSRQKWAVKKLLGYMPQEHSLYLDLTVSEFVDYVATLKDLSNSRRRKAEVERVLELVGLTKLARRRIKTLSGGMKRRVGIAQAILGDPQLLIVDEPTVGLDPEERVRFRTLLSKMASERVVILSTHIVEDISATCNQMAVIEAGKVRFLGGPGDLIRSAVGQTWELRLPDGTEPEFDWHVVRSVRESDGMRIRVVGARPTLDAEGVTPSLEDAYLVLMGSPDGGQQSEECGDEQKEQTEQGSLTT